jgi:Zn-dependent protease
MLGLAVFPLVDTETDSSWLIAGGAGVALFGSLLLHEIGHSAVAKGLGLQPSSATLFPFGAISNVNEKAPSALYEGVLATAGPMVNVGLGIGFAIAGSLTAETSRAVAAICEFLGLVNLLLALVNLYPGLPLDGGRLLRTLVWFLNGAREQGTRLAMATGLGAPLVFMAGGIALGLASMSLGVWIFLVGLCVGLVCGKRYEKAVREEEDRALR